jgi:hypothetical protein
MRAVGFEGATDVLRAPEGEEEAVYDLPIARLQCGDLPVVVSCWRLTPEDLKQVAKTGCIWFQSWGHTHPPVVVRAEPLIHPGGQPVEEGEPFMPVRKDRAQKD